jgi:alkylation response protein AidB-like acyl-CoA dehydrogenase
MTITSEDEVVRDLSDAETRIVRSAREVAQEVLAKNAERYDREAKFPADNFAALKAAGLLGPTVPKAYGGLGLRPFAYSRYLTELAKGCASTGISFHMHNVTMHYIDLLGSEEQKRHFFGEVVQGGHLFGSWGAEPSTSWAGPVALTTGFESVDGGFLISGNKYFCSLGDGARYGLLYAVEQHKTAQANRDDIQFFIVDASAAGVTVKDEWNTLGMRATVSKPIAFERVRVPELGRLGKPGDIARLPNAMYPLGYATVYAAIARAAYDWAVHHAQTRTIKPSNRPIGHFDRIQRKIGEMALAVHASSLAVDYAGRTLDQLPGFEGKQIGQNATYRAKAIATSAVLSVTGLALEVGGGPSVVKGNPPERYHRDGRTGVLMVPAFDQCVENIAKNELGFEDV